MSMFHAVVRIDHQKAQILQFNAEEVQALKFERASHHTRQHGSDVRDEHEFYGAVCDGFAGVSEVLVTGSRTALSDFRHYVEKHRHPLIAKVAGFEATDSLTDGQLVAYAKQFFHKHDRMGGVPVPE